jgi:nicotinate phosphoribosyltransferase
VKQIYRLPGHAGDVVHLAADPPPPGGEPLLRQVMVDGELLPGATPSLEEIREVARRSLAALPPEWRALRPARPYPVEFSPALLNLRQAAIREAEAQGRTPQSEG